MSDRMILINDVSTDLGGWNRFFEFQKDQAGTVHSVLLHVEPDFLYKSDGLAGLSPDEVIQCMTLIKQKLEISRLT